MTKHSKLTLIVDGNWLLMSRFSIINASNKDKPIEDIMKETCLLMVKSIKLTLKTFPSIDNVIFVSDGGSWRNSMIIPQFLIEDHISYKGNRVKSDDIDWEGVFSKFNDFFNLLTENGIMTSKAHNIEGDDWCWYWSDRLNNKEKTNCIIWSRDKDLTQLVKRNSDGFFTVCWSKEAGLTIPKANDDDTNFLFNAWYSDNDQILNDLIQNAGNKNEIDAYSVIIDKIIRGDAGDNIIPIILRASKTDKKYRVGKKDIPEHLNIYDKQEIDDYISEILNKKNYKGKVTQSKENILEHFEYNRMLVALRRDNYPQFVLDTMEMEDLIEIIPNTNFSNIENILQARKNSLEDILMNI